jgi:hypothetical protein
MMCPKAFLKLAILLLIICSIIATTSARSEDECSLLTRRYGIEASEVKIAKNSSSRDKKIEQYIRTEHSGILYSKGSVPYSYNTVDLNGDDRPEILLRLSSSPVYCDSGNSCPIEILKYNDSQYSLIDSFLSYGGLVVTSDRTNGFKDIIINYLIGENTIWKYSSFEKAYIMTKQPTKNFKVRGTAYLVCGKYFNLSK